jgi:hypothetical protein
VAEGVRRFEAVRRPAGVETTGRPTGRAGLDRLSGEPGRSRQGVEALAVGERSRPAAWVQAAGAGWAPRMQPRSGMKERRTGPGSWSGLRRSEPRSWSGVRPAGQVAGPASGRNQGGRPWTGSPGAMTATPRVEAEPAIRRAASTRPEAVGPAARPDRRAPPAARPRCPCIQRPEEPPQAPRRRGRGLIAFGGAPAEEPGQAAERSGAGRGVRPGPVRPGARPDANSGRRRGCGPSSRALRPSERGNGSDPSRQDVPGAGRFSGYSEAIHARCVTW